MDSALTAATADQESSDSDDDVTLCRQKAKPAHSDTSSSSMLVFFAALYIFMWITCIDHWNKWNRISPPQSHGQSLKQEGRRKVSAVLGDVKDMPTLFVTYLLTLSVTGVSEWTEKISSTI